VTLDIDFNYREPIEVAFADLCHSFHQTDLAAIKAGYTSQKLTTSVYLSLYSPALDWIVQCLLYKLEAKKIEQIIQQTRAGLNIPRYVTRNGSNVVHLFTSQWCCDPQFSVEHTSTRSCAFESRRLHPDDQ
jgi:hypothetical protein